MSQESVDAVRRSIEAGNRDLDELAPLLHEEIEAVYMGRTFRGRDRVVALLKAIRRTELESRSEVRRLRDVGDGRVIVESYFIELHKRSGRTTEGPQSSVYTVRDGLIARHETFASWEAALEAVGLRE
jgi:ketosteroid isomerase-like protein